MKNIMRIDDENSPTKLFSVEEANRLIPKLRPLIKAIVKNRASIMEIQGEIDKAREKAKFGGGSPWGAEYIRLMTSLTDDIAEIENSGVLVKDYRIGLCDFPHLKDGRIIYLCWKMDEDAVHYWHEIEAGFAGRQPL